MRSARGRPEQAAPQLRAAEVLRAVGRPAEALLAYERVRELDAEFADENDVTRKIAELR